MESFYINKKNYYLADDLMTNHPNYFKGCKTVRNIISKKDIPDEKYIFARNTDDEWVVSDGGSKKFDKLFISKKYFDSINVPVDTIETVPPEIYLDDTEKFTDNDGNIIEIEVVGERDVNKCFFKVKDIMNGFGLKNLQDNIIDKRSHFEKNTHYKYFYSDENGSSRNGRLKKLYLTYKGLLRVLFASNKKTADKFVDWASKVVFTAQLGTENQKQELVSNLMGVSVDAVKEVFSKNSSSIPCIYLFSLGLVKDLKKSLNISNDYDDNDFVYKWGMSIDLERRTKEHEKTFNKIKNTNLELVCFGFIDPQYISKAESEIKNLFIELDLKLDNDNFSELAIIPKKKIKFIKKQYGNISKLYMGHIAELINKIKEKDHEITLIKEKHKFELKEKENELLRKELEIMNLKNKIKK